MGSPPRMRGRVYPDCTDCEEGGITPAYAGKRKRKLKPKRLTGDHPRVCGEESATWEGLTKAFGITPAYAGKSQSSVALL